MSPRKPRTTPRKAAALPAGEVNVTGLTTLELRVDASLEAGLVLAPDAELALLGVTVPATTAPADLEAILAGLGPAAGTLSRRSAADVPAGLSSAWARRYARAPRPPEEETPAP